MAADGGATCTQDFHFESGQLHVTFQANYGGEERGAQFLKDIKKVLPNIIGLAKVIDQKGESVDIFLGCQQFNKAEIEISKIKFKTMDCDTSDTAHVVLALADELDKKIIPGNYFNGFTLQIAYIDRGGDVLKEKKRWRNKLDDVIHNGTMYIEGDCTQTTIWTYEYPENSSVIRFGIFDSFENAKKAITILKLGKKHSQIVPIKFKIRDLDKYFE